MKPVQRKRCGQGRRCAVPVCRFKQVKFFEKRYVWRGTAELLGNGGGGDGDGDGDDDGGGEAPFERENRPDSTTARDGVCPYARRSRLSGCNHSCLGDAPSFITPDTVVATQNGLGGRCPGK